MTQITIDIRRQCLLNVILAEYKINLACPGWRGASAGIRESYKSGGLFGQNIVYVGRNYKYDLTTLSSISV